MSYKTCYGSFSSTQIHSVKLSIQKSIFFLLLYVDPKTSDAYRDVDIESAFINIQYKLDGLNSLLYEPPELVMTMALLESALAEFRKSDFDFRRYRKLILDAGSEIMRLKEGDSNGD